MRGRRRSRADLSRWQQLAREDLGGKDPQELVWMTPDGIPVKPLYTAADLEALAFSDSLPGAPPFLRLCSTGMRCRAA